MASSTTAQILQNNGRNYSTDTSEIKREEVEAAIAKSLELRALHSALVRGNNSPSSLRFSSVSSPVPHHLSLFSVQDYPVFTPSYEDEPVPGYRQIQLESRTLSKCWDEYGIKEGNCEETEFPDYRKANASSRNEFLNLEPHLCPAEDQKSTTGSFTNNISLSRNSPGNDFCKSSRRNSLREFKSLSSSCNKCNPPIISKDLNVIVPLTDSHSSLHSQPKRSGLNKFSWLFPHLKKKNKNENSPNRMELEEKVFHSGVLSIEGLKKELVEANESRDAALMEVAEMKSSMGDLKQKLDSLENYCGELKKALREAMQTKENDSQVLEKIGNWNSLDGKGEDSMPVSEEVMVEGLLQIVSEARLSVNQFCKSLVCQIEETDSALMENLNSLLLPYKLSINSKHTKAVLYHLEAIINQTLYQDFENSVFQKNGSPKYLDPIQDRQSRFSSFVSLRNLSWNEVLRKGTKYYSEEFSKFCDQKMSCIISTMNWTRPWPENLLQSFFVAAKCIWLLHLLAFSFNPPVGILRVEENRNFDSHFMENISMGRGERSNSPSRVKVMVMPGFYVKDRVVRCNVICRYKSVI